MSDTFETYGLLTKTINIPVSAGKNRFDLQQNNELGLPDDALIVAIQCRSHDDTIISSDGDPLVLSTVFENAYITIKDRECENGRINMLLSQYHMESLIDKAFFMENKESGLIDWNNSFIEVNRRANADLAIVGRIGMYSNPVIRVSL